MRTVNNLTLFFSEHDEFSNWYRSDFEVKGMRFMCMEQFMMFCKAKLFGDEEIAKQIMQATHPRDHKSLGRKVSGYDEDIWKARRESIVASGCYAKFSQNEDLKKLLLSTKDTILVEASRYDRIWGVGLSENDPRIQDPTKWKGLNLLGNALMRTRSRIASELKLEQRTTPPDQSAHESGSKARATSNDQSMNM